jgi:hypothetical protein
MGIRRNSDCSPDTNILGVPTLEGYQQGFDISELATGVVH